MTSPGRRPTSAHSSAVAVVVLPMPISPVATMSYPFSAQKSMSSIPTFMAFSHSSWLMAGSETMSPVPFRTFSFLTPAKISSLSIPISTGITSIPSLFVITQTELCPVPRSLATSAVTLFPHWETPSRTTPLSAHSTTKALRERSGITLPCIDAILEIRSSRSPSPSMGLAIASHLFLDAL